MNPELYNAAIKGNIAVLVQYKDHLEVQVTPNNNTVLHVAALFNDNWHLVKDIIALQPSLLRRVNSKGDTPLHIAARHGHGNAVQALIERAKEMGGDTDLESGIGVAKKMLRMTNNEGNTALHEVVWKNDPTIVSLLVEEDPGFPHPANNADETPLYLAAERGLVNVLSKILSTCTSPAYTGPDGTTALHGAVAANSKGCTRRLLEWKPSLTKKADNHGGMPLHYAAKLGYKYQTRQLLDVDKSVAYLTASEGNNMKTPLHLAAKWGQLEVMKELISSCPDCWEMVDSKGQNILHLATSNKQQDVVNFILKDPRLGSLINQKDDEGNTPLHLFAANFGSKYQRMLCNLLKNPRVDEDIHNKENVTPLNILSNKDIPRTLKKAYSINAFRWGTRNLYKEKIQSSKLLEEGDLDETQKKKWREYLANTHLLVAAFIATVTFAAGFTVPGGYDGNTGSNQGMAVLARAVAFKAFIISDTMALIFSTLAVFLHFRATACTQHSETWIWHLASANLFIMLAMVAMVVAFTTGVYAVLGNSRGVAIAVCLLGSFSLLLLFHLIWRQWLRAYKFLREELKAAAIIRNKFYRYK